MPEPSILDARLAEIDRRLRVIQSGLEPVAEPADDRVAEHRAPPPPATPYPRSSPPPPAPPLGAPPPLAAPPPSAAPPPASAAARRPAPPSAPIAGDARDEQIAVLTTRLSELTATHERLLATTQNLLIEQADVLARAVPAVSVAAGPFTDSRALHAFQEAVRGLPQVRDVAIREYVGSEGVVLDVHPEPPIS